MRVPVVFTVHGWAFTRGVPPLYAAVYRKMERHGDETCLETGLSGC
jgi:hypothetical protein